MKGRGKAECKRKRCCKREEGEIEGEADTKKINVKLRRGGDEYL